MVERSDGWTKAFSVPLPIPPVPCYTFFMKAARQTEVYTFPHKKCIFPQKALDTKSARRIMPSDTRYPIPDTRYPIPDTCIKARCRAARFYASSFAGCAGETRGHTAFITHIQTYIHEIVLISAQTCGHIARIACNFFTMVKKRYQCRVYSYTVIHSVL